MSKKKGFTLIELLVAVLIIGILAAIAFPKYQIAVDKANYMQIVTLVTAVKEAQERYYMAKGEYTTNFNNLDITIPLDADVTGSVIQKAGKWAVRINSVNDFVSGGIVNAYYYPAKVSYIVYLDRRPTYAGVRQCRSVDRGERGKKLCLSLGGVYETENENNGTVYILP